MELKTIQKPVDVFLLPDGTYLPVAGGDQIESLLAGLERETGKWHPVAGRELEMV